MKLLIFLCLIGVAFSYRIERDVSDSSPEEEVNPEELVNILKEMCANTTGSDEAFQRAFTAFQELTTCLENEVDFEKTQNEIQTNLINAKSSEEVDLNPTKMFESICPKIEPAYKCVLKFTTVAKECLEEEDHEELDTLLNLVKSLADYVCFNNGEHVITFFEDDGLECVMENGEKFQKCYEEEINKYTKQKKENNISIDFFDKKEECDSFDEQSACTIQVAKTGCKKESISKIIQEVFGIVKSATKCHTY